MKDNKYTSNQVAPLIKNRRENDRLKNRIHLLIKIAFTFAISFCAFFLFLKLKGEVVENDITQFDTYISLAIYSIRTPWLTVLMQSISFLGMQATILGAIILSFFFVVKKQKQEALLLFFLLAGGIFMDLLFKTAIGRPRPTMSPLVPLPFDPSFPSGHAMNAMVFYALISYFMFHFSSNSRYRILVSAGASIIVLLVGISRIYLGVHYPSDVVAGYVVGIWWLGTILAIDRTCIRIIFPKK